MSNQQNDHFYETVREAEQENMWENQSLITILEDIAEEYCEHAGQPNDKYIYVEMINAPTKRDKQSWPIFTEFAMEVLDGMLNNRHSN